MITLCVVIWCIIQCYMDYVKPSTECKHAFACMPCLTHYYTMSKELNFSAVGIYCYL